MTRTWIEEVLLVGHVGPMVRAVVTDTQGSCPRDAGASMLIWDGATSGTIGGGALEFDVVRCARSMLEDEHGGQWQRRICSYHLGPELNQCCGGAVTVLLERFGAEELLTMKRMAEQGGPVVRRPLVSGTSMEWGNSRLEERGLPLVWMRGDGVRWFSEYVLEARTPIHLYGAGHVGRALVRAFEGLPFDVTWIDVDADRFSGACAHGARTVIETHPEVPAGSAPQGTFHLVMTHSHALDEVIVEAIMRSGVFSYLGLIGSETKSARFRQRLLRSGIGEEVVVRLACPIGLAGLRGKPPELIAASVVADLLLRRQAVSAIGG